MKLDKLYSLRTDFTIIGLTGRTGSGCSKIAELLSLDFPNLEACGLRDEPEFTDTTFYRKYEICKNYLSHSNNWKPFIILKYTNVLLFYILHQYGGEHKKISELFLENFKEHSKEANKDVVYELMNSISKIDKDNDALIKEIKSLKNFHDIRTDDQLLNLEKFFFDGRFEVLASKIFEALETNGYLRTRKLLHWVSCNIRSTGDCLGKKEKDIKNIYSIAILINRLIKAKRLKNGNEKPTKIVIDSLRNSLEIMFFKERYSAFYMLATKDVIGNAKERLDEKIKEKIKVEEGRKNIIEQLLQLDATEYRTKDFSRGEFSSPDVENCIQKSDYHIFNLKKEHLEEFAKEKLEGNSNGFFTREEQLMKLVALIHQPGIITPSAAERAMQIANTAKLNSGCISRKVGAVVTNSEYYILSVGWNDVPKGHTPCNLRDVTDFQVTPIKNEKHYSKFEKGDATGTSTYKYKGEIPGNFKDALVEYFHSSLATMGADLNGKNCSFCFKTVHNHYEGESNQVHTRSLHAEENAMLQITKLGGVPEKDGYLFTTASPCELCSKKAYQLGIKKIFYIDPYPGISIDQILEGGNSQPVLIPFLGAIGSTYHELYEPFMSYKDEIAMTLELKPQKKISKEITNILNEIRDPEINDFLKKTKLNDDEVIELVKFSIKSYKEKNEK